MTEMVSAKQIYGTAWLAGTLTLVLGIAGCFTAEAPSIFKCGNNESGCQNGYKCDPVMGLCVPEDTKLDGPTPEAGKDMAADQGADKGKDLSTDLQDGPVPDKAKDLGADIGQDSAQDKGLDKGLPDGPNMDGPKPDTGGGCPKGKKCNDKDPCTVNDVCDGKGGCAGTPSLWDTLLWDQCTWG